MYILNLCYVQTKPQNFCFVYEMLCHWSKYIGDKSGGNDLKMTGGVGTFSCKHKCDISDFCG